MLNMKPCGYMDKYEWNIKIKLSRNNVFDEEFFRVEKEMSTHAHVRLSSESEKFYVSMPYKLHTVHYFNIVTSSGMWSFEVKK